jgi:hypothetical protein
METLSSFLMPAFAYHPPNKLQPECPNWMAFRSAFFFEHRMGIWFLIAGFVLQLSGVWIWV